MFYEETTYIYDVDQQMNSENEADVKKEIKQSLNERLCLSNN